jgi:TolB protein
MEPISGVLISGGPRFRVDHWGGIAWSRDGEQIAFTVGNHMAGDRYGETLQLYVAAGDGTNVRPLRGTPLGSLGPTWSPDSSRIAFAIRGEDETSIAVIGADGKGLRKLASSTNPQDFYWTPDWSPDGAWILFEIASYEGPRSRLMAVRPDGRALHQLATFNTGNHCICADWSPDGERIAYQAPGTPPRYDYPEIWVMNADGSGRVQLTRNGTRDENPDWSPDGKRIAFYSERTGNAEIHLIPAAGGQARRVTHDSWYNGAPRWRPTG